MLPKTKLLSLRHLKFSHIPDSPGVYIFWQKSKPLYIGKASNLKSRLKSYFTLNLATKTRAMIGEADYLSFVKVSSELESLLLEAKLISANKPKYNSSLRDDKHPLYIKITKDAYPRVVTARKIEAKKDYIAFFGPFPSSTSVRFVLKLLRQVFPYAEHLLGKKACIYSQIGLCNPCPNYIENLAAAGDRVKLRHSYLKNLRSLKRALEGKIGSIRKELNREMQRLSDSLNYEEAQKVKEKIVKLEYITQPIIPSSAYLENPNLFEDIRKNELRDLKAFLKQDIPVKNLRRIECYDVAHLSGASTTASMVTFVNAEAQKSAYRHFRVRGNKPRDDVSALTEVLKRRIKHLADWGRPDLVLVDGGKSQVASFYKALNPLHIPALGIAKRDERLVIPYFEKGAVRFLERKLARGPGFNLVTRIRNEAHRFARRYHHTLVKKTLLNYT